MIATFASGSWVLGALVLDVVAKALLLLAIATAAVRLERRAPASVRHRTWTVAIVAVLLLPAMVAFLPQVPIVVHEAVAPPAAGEPMAAVAPAPSPLGVAEGTAPSAAAPSGSGPEGLVVVAGPLPEPSASSAVASAVLEPAAPSSGRSVPWIAWLWLAGAVFATVPYGVGLARARGIARRSRRPSSPFAEGAAEAARAALGLRRHVRVLESDEVASPATWGFLHPVVVLPEESREWSRDRLDLVLTHECAHVRRFDGLVELAARCAAALHWFDPLAWLALAGLRRESEDACDAVVVGAGASPSAYARCLLDVARGPSPVSALGMARPASLERRIRAVLEGRRARAGRWSLVVGTIVAAGVLVFVTVLHPVSREVAGDEPAAAYDVAPDGTAAHKTVQEAVDAAAAGATIRIAPGTYDGQVVIRKAVTLVGAGPDRTTLTSDISYDTTVRAPQGSDEPIRPTVRVESATDVTLREMTLTGRSKRQQGVIRGDAVVVVGGGAARFERCALVDTASSGMLVARGADVVLARCLVGAIASEGVVVRQSKARLTDCDVRDVLHYGIHFDHAAEGCAVERCRISGSLWHGIRYDDCSPTVSGNRIAGNYRSGIYASGRTAATVEGNVFVGNDMSGMSCWFANRDTVRRNTFATNAREALAVVGAADPLVERNVLWKSPIGVAAANTQGSPFAGPLRLEGNWFFEVERPATRPGDPGEGPLVDVPWEGLSAKQNVKGDPGFVDATKGDFTLKPDAPARAAGAGADAPLGAESPWPLRKEEIAWRQTLAEERPAPPTAPGEDPFPLAKPWIEALHSLTDAAARDGAIAKIREALASDQAVMNHAAFLAIARTADVTWDRAALRPLVLERLAKAKGAAQVSGYYALASTERKPEDLDLLLASLDEPSPEMQRSGSHLLFMFTKGEIAGKAGEAVLRLLAAKSPGVLREVLRGLWGARVSPEVEARLIELSKTDDQSLYHDVIYFALSTLRDKSPAVVAALARAIEGADRENAGRAVWGLSHGVAPAAQPAAADLFMALVELRSDPSLQQDALRGLGEYGGPAHAAKLRALLAKPDFDASRRRPFEEALRRIESKGASAPGPKPATDEGTKPKEPAEAEPPHPGAAFVGAAECKKCHLKQFKSWSGTDMAKAFRALQPGQATERKARASLDPNTDFSKDPKCLRCHTTGYGQPGAKAEDGVSCEACHGPGGDYGPYKKEHPDYKFADVAKLGLRSPPAAADCLRCHVKECPAMPADYAFDAAKALKDASAFHERFPLKTKHR